MAHINWGEATEQQKHIVNEFKNIFVHQETSRIDEIFSTKFGRHNGVSLSKYCEYEFYEFALKCQKFGLTDSATVKVFQPKDGYIYFSLGDSHDAAIFEAIFLWDNEEGKLLGNQYFGKIEPKIQFFKNSKNEISSNRRINLKSEYVIKNVIPKVSSDNFSLNSVELEDFLGGSFSNFTFEKLNEDLLTFWDNISIFTDKGIFKHDVLMRGKDHPLFVDNLYLGLSEDKKTVTFTHNVTPVVISIILKNGEELFYKYPTEKSWTFDQEVVYACLTDSLSFDWIISDL